MPTIRIKDLPTTASSSSSTDFLALDGSVSGTRKLNAFSPSFGGALSAASASFTTALPLTSGGTGATTQAGAANAVLPSQTSQSGKYLTTDGTNVSWGTVSAGGGTWGSITGTLSNQTDLQNALNAKASLSGATFTGTITSTLGTLTASTPALDLSQTWNNAGVNFTGARINITNTASGASSYILDLRVGGASVLQIDKQGRLLYETNGGWQGFGFIGQGRAGMGYGSDTVFFFHNSVTAFGYTDTRFTFDSSYNFGWAASGAGTGQDIGFRRNASGVIEINNGTAGTFRDLTLRALTASSTITDSAGNVRSIPQNSQTAAYTLVVGDNGKHISITTGGVTVPSGVFSAGQVVTIFNNSASNQTITQGASTTMYQAGTTNTGNRTLASYGVATVLCVASNTFVIAGSGIS